ncbi:DUF6884 domain-containing protein [Paraburkholderia sp. BCC1876]|uniref:DUF6884 domain-containing protein n=1 Tax=Paraburkholderia sp. BCC1876 TaxID=2676303 RepID=UPI00158FF666|nr:DUF6884 domain-containing protein [Paraburkholderia sp. BCC1876]
MNKNKPVILVSCVAKKRSLSIEAKDLYLSDLFDKSRQFAEIYGEKWFILSAKHGLLDPNEIIAPYDVTLKNMSRAQRRTWAIGVVESLDKHIHKDQPIIILAGEYYRDDIEPMLSQKKFDVSAPLVGLPIGKQLQALGRLVQNAEMVADQDRFFKLIDKLSNANSGYLRFSDFESKSVSSRGLYFFLDPTELRRFPTMKNSRVVRIGTHAVSEGSKSTLWQRLKAHRGTDDRGGSHRSSIFRLHVGHAILSSRKFSQDSWGIGETASKETRETEKWLEHEVSDYIRELHVLTLPILDLPGPDSDRSYIERNSIALLSGQGTTSTPGNEWLGNASKMRSIRESGLWNVNYVNDRYDDRFLDVLDELVERAITGNVSPNSISPENWRATMQHGLIGQKTLFDS